MTIRLDRIVVRSGWLQNNHVNVPKSIVEVCLGREAKGQAEFHVRGSKIGTGALQQSTGHLTGVADLLSVMDIKKSDFNVRELRVWVNDAEKDRLHFEDAPQTSRALEWKGVEQVQIAERDEVFFFNSHRGVFAYQAPREDTVWLRTPYQPSSGTKLSATPSLAQELADRMRLDILHCEHQIGPLHHKVDDLESEEGRLVLIVHMRHERAPGLVQAKLKSVPQPNCEVCGFNFERRYGVAGSGFAEIHHRTPLASSRRITSTTLKDLAIVCANCHRMLHRKPWPSVQELGALLQTEQ